MPLTRSPEPPFSRLQNEPATTGAARFVGDLTPSGTLFATFVRSQIAHGTIRHLDIAPALEMPGVAAVYTGRNTDLPPLPGGAGIMQGMRQPVFAHERVRFVGEALALVVSETPAQGADARDLLWPEIDPLPPVGDATSALLPDSPLLFPDVGTNRAIENMITDSPARPSTSWGIKTAVSVDIPRVSPTSLEPLSFLCIPTGRGLTIYCGHQAPARLPGQLASALGIRSDSIGVKVPFVGGAFGAKSALYPEYVAVAHAALDLNLPVVWLQSRSESLTCGTHGRAQTIDVELAASADGRVHQAQISIVADLGAYPVYGATVPLFTQYVAQGPYLIEDVEIKAQGTVTNRAPVGPYRGAGRPEAAIALERAMDALAVDLGMPPEQVRRMNFIPSQALPYQTATGAIYDSGDYDRALMEALRVADIDGLRQEQRERRNRKDPSLMGIGMAAFIERSGGPVASGEYGSVTLGADGRIQIVTGSVSAGQGHQETWTKIVCGTFEVPPESVDFIAGDTRYASEGTGTFASRSTQVGASAIYRMAIATRDEARRLASEMLEAASVDLVLSEDGFQVIGSPHPPLSLASIAAYASAQGRVLASEEVYYPGAQTFPYGAYVAIVDIEETTGEVNIRRIIAVDDCGVVLNPAIVDGQVRGSIMQGIGESLSECIVYDDLCQPLTTNLMGYLVPSSLQKIPLLSSRISTPAPSNPLGVKGIGEAGCIGAPAAILNAVHDALHGRITTQLNFPLTPSRVWTWLNSNQ